MSKKNQKLIENGYVSVKGCRHGCMMYNVNDTFIGRSLDLYGEWCESELTLLGHIIHRDDTVVDVGANIGTHTIFFAKAVGPNGMVYALEPQRAAYQMLCGNAALNAQLNVRCVNAGAGSEPGSMKVPVLDPTASQNFGALRLGKFEQGETVEIITLDQLELTHCDLIKIDVEGAEADVVSGATHTIGRHQPVLFVENNTEDRSCEIIETIQALKYKCWWHISSYFNPNNYFKNKKNVFQRFVPEANLLCIPAHIPAEIKGLPPVEGPEDNWRKAIQRVRVAE